MRVYKMLVFPPSENFTSASQGIHPMITSTNSERKSVEASPQRLLLSRHSSFAETPTSRFKLTSPSNFKRSLEIGGGTAVDGSSARLLSNFLEVRSTVTTTTEDGQLKKLIEVIGLFKATSLI